MSQKKPLLIDLPYLPCISWIKLAEQYDEIYIDAFEYYVKGTYRNRCHILGPNGLQRLSIPLVKGKHQHTPIKDVCIDHNSNWQKIHWQSLCSAYRRSVYFEYFEDVLYPFYHKRIDGLMAFNHALLQVIFKILKMPQLIIFTEHYISKDDSIFDDYRSVISPKKKNMLNHVLPAYTQVFSDRFTFFNDLSIVDYIFNTGNK